MRSCLICDDHALMRDALAATIASRWPDAECHVAAGYDETWEVARRLSPDLCLVDLVMPGATPIDGVAKLLEVAPEARVIVVTGTQDDDILLELLRRGVHGFLQKTNSGKIILAAIELVLSGGRYLPPRVAELAMGRPAGAAEAAGADRGPTGRQRDVLVLIAHGKSNKEIARALGVSPATVKTHVTNAIASVGAANRTDAAVRAKSLGLI